MFTSYRPIAARTKLPLVMARDWSVLPILVLVDHFSSHHAVNEYKVACLQIIYLSHIVIFIHIKNKIKRLTL